MYNKKVEKLLHNTEQELVRLGHKIRRLSPFDDTRSIVAKYALIISYGSIERAFKDIVIDACSINATTQIKNFLLKNFDKNAFNFKYDELCKKLEGFDGEWRNNFKEDIKKRKHAQKYKTSLASLFDTRNEFAHGGNPNVTLTDVKNYFKDCAIVVKIFDRILNK
ncbi:MAG: HEPN domain-containing protein [Candidatus Moranbacteria bacterium]|jgi:hypothetical protein|nr:HEPN domain-containing protein [Candidatus Moranbacteria bacterium]